MSGMGSDIDDVLEDIAESEGLLLGSDTDLDRPMSRLSVKGPSEVQVPASAPSVNELRLGRRVLELEKERDNLAAELKALKLKSQQSTTSPTTTIPSSQAPATQADVGTEIQIPRELIPIFSVLRHHISELTKDNHALRYTFGLDTGPPSSPDNVDVHANAPIASPSETIEGGPSKSKRVEIPGLDLEAVVNRVKELVRENEELGHMVIELGKASTEEWESALEESKRVITSLDNDLQHHFETVQTLREQLEAYTNQPAPPPQQQILSTSGSGPGSGRPQSDTSSMRPSSPRSSHGGHGGRNQRDKDRRGTTSGRGGGGGGGGGAGGGGRQGDDRRQTYQGENIDRHRQDRDRVRDIAAATTTAPREAEQDRSGGNDFNPRTDRSTAPSQRRREEDRMSKRRR